MPVSPLARRVSPFLAAALLAWSSAAMAQVNDSSWVASEGGDQGNCAAIQPCATLAYAAQQTLGNGTINIMDSGDYGNVVLTRPVTIRGGDGLKPTVAGSITINAGPTDRVAIFGIDLVGANGAHTYGTGINVQQAGEVLVDQVRIKDFQNGGAGKAINIASTSQVRLTLNGSLLYNNAAGVVVTSNGGTGHLKMFNTLLLGNTQYGVSVIGDGNDAFLAGDQVLGSKKAIDLQDGGQAKSFGNNIVTNGDPMIPGQNG